jgi:hypothetical protein
MVRKQLWGRLLVYDVVRGLMAQTTTGQQIHEGGGTLNLSAAEWLDRWRAFRRHAAGGGKSN